MSIYYRQLEETRKIDKPPATGISVVIYQDNKMEDAVKRTLESLRQQIHQKFSVHVVCAHDLWGTGNGFDENVPAMLAEAANIKCRFIRNLNYDYVYFIKAGNRLAPTALLEFARALEEDTCQILYSDEGIFRKNSDELLFPIVKPDYTRISFLEEPYTGQSVLWKKELILQNLNRVSSVGFDTNLRELMILCLPKEDEIRHIKKILLQKEDSDRNADEEKQLVRLVNQKMKDIGYDYEFQYRGGYYPYGFEIKGHIKMEDVTFVLLEEDLLRTRQTLSQIVKCCRDSRIQLHVYESDKQELTAFADELCAGDRIEIAANRSPNFYTDFYNAVRTVKTTYQIWLRDAIEWLNQEDILRMLHFLLVPEIEIVSPMIAASAEDSDNNAKIIYAGGIIQGISLNAALFSGREQAAYGELDLAWGCREIEMLTSYCMGYRSSFMKEILPLDQSVSLPEEIADEISLRLLGQNQPGWYCGRSTLWVNPDIKNRKPGCSDSGYLFYALEKHNETINRYQNMSEWIDRSYHSYISEKSRFYIDGFQYKKDRKYILVVSNELSLTGAPIVLMQALQVLKENGYEMMLVSPVDGILKEKVLGMQIPVMIDPQIESRFNWIAEATNFDLVLVNTVVMAKVAEQLDLAGINTLWWSHDSRMGYANWHKFRLPERLSEHTQVYNVSAYSEKVLLEYRPGYHSKRLFYGVEDNLQKRDGSIDFGFPLEKIKFVNIGLIISRKGQDVLIDAISHLPADVLEASYFVFVGGVIDDDLFKELNMLIERYPEHVCYIPQIYHENMADLYEQTDVVVCSSKDDPLPTFIAEGMMMGKACICSENTGFVDVIENGRNGFIYHNDSSDELMETIIKIVRNQDILKEIEPESRKTYEDTFSNAIFSQNIIKAVESCMRNQ